MEQPTENKEVSKLKSMQVQLAQYQPVAATERADNNGVLKFGADNLYPQYLKKLSSTSPIHGALTKGIARMIAGKSLKPKDAASEVLMKEMKVEKAWKSICNDVELYGGCYVERTKTKDAEIAGRKFSSIGHLPYENCRLAVDQLLNVTGIWYSRNWELIGKPENKARFIPMAGTDENAATEVVISFIDETTSTLYPEPSYVSAINYIELDRSIGQFHVSNLKNGFFPSTIISLFNGEPEPDAKECMKKYFNEQTGAENSGQVLLLFNEKNDTPPTIESFPLSDAHQMYESLAKQATEKIMIGHLVTTPLLFGVRGEGSGFSSNDDELKQGFKIFTENVIEPYRADALETLTKACQIEGIEVVPNTYFEGEQESGSPQEENVASQALNGAQIESLVNIIMQAAANTLPIDSAKSVVAAGFPMLTQVQIDSIFNDIVPGTIPQQQVLSSKLSKIHLSNPDMSDDDEDSWLQHLYERGEVVDLDEYELIDELSGEVGSPEDEEKIHKEIEAKNQGAVEMYKAYANPDEKSEMDGGIYKVRYGYPTKSSKNSRRFCKAMAQAAQAGVEYRYEDIVRMGDEGVNGGFAAAGETSYSIFLYKGGVNCHHFWSRKVYRRKRDAKGKILPNKGLSNDERITQNEANKKGFDFKDSEYWSKAKQRPIDMPNQGRKN